MNWPLVDVAHGTGCVYPPVGSRVQEWLFVRWSEPSTVSVADSIPLPASDAEYASCFWPEFHPVETPPSDGAPGGV